MKRGQAQKRKDIATKMRKTSKKMERRCTANESEEAERGDEDEDEGQDEHDGKRQHRDKCFCRRASAWEAMGRSTSWNARACRRAQGWATLAGLCSVAQKVPAAKLGRAPQFLNVALVLGKSTVWPIASYCPKCWPWSRAQVWFQLLLFCKVLLSTKSAAGQRLQPSS